MTRAILILGATSSISRAMAEQWAERGHPLFLASRDSEELERQAADLQLRYQVPVQWEAIDLLNPPKMEPFLTSVEQRVGQLKGVLLASGNMGNAHLLPYDADEVRRVLLCNFVGAAQFLSSCARHLSQRKSGFIIGISSVAGERAKSSNYIYGSAKSGLSAFLAGLRADMHSHGVHVMTVKPGFVDTAMTFGRPGLFWVASPHQVAKVILKALKKRRNEIYVPWFWRGIMAIIKGIPECIYKQLKL